MLSNYNASDNFLLNLICKEIIRASLLLALVTSNLSCTAQTSIDKICINNVKVQSDSTWVFPAISPVSSNVYEDKEDEIEEYDFVYYYSGKAKVQLYHKGERLFPGSVSVTNTDGIIQLGSFAPISPGDAISDFSPELLDVFTRQIPYRKEGKPLPLDRLPDVSGEFTFRLDDGHLYYLTVVCFLENGIIKRIALNFAY